jgi:hypothetical protein
MWPRIGQSRTVSLWITVTVIATIASYLDGGWLDRHAAFSPARIWSGEVWRLGTWVFFVSLPMGLVYTGVAIYRFGGELAVRWGEQRLRTFVIEVIGFAAIATAMLALVFDSAMWLNRFGGTVAFDVLAIAWAKQFPTAQLAVFYGTMTITGRTFIKVVIGINVLLAIALGPFYMAPELIACAAAYYYPAERLRRR